MKILETIKKDMEKMMHFFSENKATQLNVLNYFGYDSVFFIETNVDTLSNEKITDFDINYSSVTLTLTIKNDTLDNIRGIEVWNDTPISESEKNAIDEYFKTQFNTSVIEWIVF